jgi:hypothetical protein
MKPPSLTKNTIYYLYFFLIAVLSSILFFIILREKFTKSGKYPLNITAILKNPITGVTREYQKTFEVNVE